MYVKFNLRHLPDIVVANITLFVGPPLADTLTMYCENGSKPLILVPVLVVNTSPVLSVQLIWHAGRNIH